MKKFGFTLIEVMVVLVILGILTCTLLPNLFKEKPDEKVAKFKKAHNDFREAITQLVTSDKYFIDGDFAQPLSSKDIDKNGVISTFDAAILEQGVGNTFCDTLADVLSAKYTNCTSSKNTTQIDWYGTGPYPATRGSDVGYIALNLDNNGQNPTSAQITFAKQKLDDECKKSNQQIITLDNGVQIFESQRMFANFLSVRIMREYSAESDILFGGFDGYYSPVARVCALGGECPDGSSGTYPVYFDADGFGTKYKIFCIDIDGVHENATNDNCVNECPFGYGVRGDGHIITGLRADEWVKREIK